MLVQALADDLCTLIAEPPGAQNQDSTPISKLICLPDSQPTRLLADPLIYESQVVSQLGNEALPNRDEKM